MAKIDNISAIENSPLLLIQATHLSFVYRHSRLRKQYQEDQFVGHVASEDTCNYQ